MALLLALPLASYADGNVDQEAKEQNTPEGWTPVELPQLPEITATNTFDITKYGASTTSEDNTEAIQAALNAVPSTGGMVVIPAGEWLCGPITMKSKTVLHLAANATLKLLPYGKYPVSKVEGNKKSYDNFISNGKSEITDAIVEGEDKNTSIIEGQGGPWWDVIETDEKDNISRGAVIRFTKGSRFLIRNLTVQNAPGVNITISQNGKASHGTIHDVIIREPSSSAADPSHNTDGISMWGHHINIYNCDISNGDDNVAIKCGRDNDGWKVGVPSENIIIRNCRFKGLHAVVIGSEMSAGVRNVFVENCTFGGYCKRGIYIKTNPDRGGFVSDLYVKNCEFDEVEDLFYATSMYAGEGLDNDKYTRVGNIFVDGMRCRKASKAGLVLQGTEAEPIRNVVFSNVEIGAAENAISFDNTEGVEMINCHIGGRAGVPSMAK